MSNLLRLCPACGFCDAPLSPPFARECPQCGEQLILENDEEEGEREEGDSEE